MIPQDQCVEKVFKEVTDKMSRGIKALGWWVCVRSLGLVSWRKKMNNDGVRGGVMLEDKEGTRAVAEVWGGGGGEVMGGGGWEVSKPEDIVWLYQHAVAVAGSCFKVWYCGRYENKGSGLMSVSLSQDCLFEALPSDAIPGAVTCRVWAEIPGDSVSVLFEAVLVEVRGHFWDGLFFERERARIRFGRVRV